MKKTVYQIFITFAVLFILGGSADLKAGIVGTPDNEYTTIGGGAEEAPQPRQEPTQVPQPSQPSQQPVQPQETPAGQAESTSGVGSGRSVGKKKVTQVVEEPEQKQEEAEVLKETESVSENSVSENSVSENSVSENTISENTVSEPVKKEPEKKTEKKETEKKEVKPLLPAPEPEEEPEPAKHIGLTIFAAYLIVLLSLAAVYVIFFATFLYYKEPGTGEYKWTGIVFPKKDDDGYAVRIRKNKKSDNYKIVFKMKFANKHYGEPLSITSASADTQSSISKEVLFDLF